MHKGIGVFFMLGMGVALSIPAMLEGEWIGVAVVMGFAALLATWA